MTAVTDSTNGDVWIELGNLLAQVLERSVESGLGYPLTMTVAAGNGSVMAMRFPALGETPVFLAENILGGGMALPLSGLVTDLKGGAVYIRITLDGFVARLLDKPTPLPMIS